jgi:hypothetical protein
MKRPIENLKKLQEDADKEHKDLLIECDMLQGNINRMMVTDDAEELLKMFAFAHKRLGNIFWANRARISNDKRRDY